MYRRALPPQNNEGYLWEEGPNSFQPSMPILRMAADSGVKDELVFGDPEAPRFVWWENKLRPVPGGLLARSPHPSSLHSPSAFTPPPAPQPLAAAPLRCHARLYQRAARTTRRRRTCLCSTSCRLLARSELALARRVRRALPSHRPCPLHCTAHRLHPLCSAAPGSQRVCATARRLPLGGVGASSHSSPDRILSGHPSSRSQQVTPPATFLAARSLPACHAHTHLSSQGSPPAGLRPPPPDYEESVEQFVRRNLVRLPRRTHRSLLIPRSHSLAPVA